MLGRAAEASQHGWLLDGWLLDSASVEFLAYSFRGLQVQTPGPVLSRSREFKLMTH